MRRFRNYILSKPHVAISVTALLCFVQFISGLYGALRAGMFDNNTINQLLSSADGFESVVLFVIASFLRKKD